MSESKNSITERHLEVLETPANSPAEDFLQSLAQEDLLRELLGDSCFCGVRKQARQTFCRRHYFALNKPMRQALYAHMGQGYEEAYSAARRFLQAKPASQEAGRITLGALGLLLMFVLLLAVFAMAMSANV